MSRYRFLLAKQDFKFSSAHFTIFGPHRAEPLHGHNYRVAVEISGDRVDDLGLLFDLDPVKRTIRALCAHLDEKTLVPGSCRYLQVLERDERVELRFDQRVYSIPAEDVLVLPVVNLTIEELASFFCRSLLAELGLRQAAGETVPSSLREIRQLAVRVEETDGQSCSFVAEVDSAPS